jgi:uncharacterized protein (TIGR03663 family)
MPASPKKSRPWLDRPVFESFPLLTGEGLIFIVIVLLVTISRLANLGERVMSHDESLHVFFSWLFYQGQGYQHNPMMHGPLQFHLIAFIYFLFGDSDFTARLPHAIASILTVVLLWNWRRYLGRAGTLIAAGLMLISPFMLYYGRYARNEAFVGLFGVLTLYAILRYLETGYKRYIFLLTLAIVLHFTAKETAFIYTAQALLFLAVYLIGRVTRSPWKKSNLYNSFVIALGIGVILLGLSFGIILYNHAQNTINAAQTVAPLNPRQTPAATGLPAPSFSASTSLLVIATLAFVTAAVLLGLGYGWKNVRRERSFDLLALLGTLVLPQLTALPVKWVGWNPLDYYLNWPGWNLPKLLSQGPVRVALIFIPIVTISIVLGVLWNKRLWLWNALLFYGVYIFFYSTVLTNWQGIFTGLVGSLGYWLEQQGVQRGSQPWYYYLLIQIPIYEYLPALGICLATYFGLRHKTPAPLPSTGPNPEPEPVIKGEGNRTFGLLLWWSLTSLFAYTLAGEKMPWLTYHIAWPMILLTGWALGQLVERIDWLQVRTRRGILIFLLLTVFCISLAGTLSLILGPTLPFQGKTLSELSNTSTFLFWFVTAVGSALGLVYLATNWEVRDVLRLGGLTVFGLLVVLTARTAFRAAYVDYNDASEYLVYAHGASGVKDVMGQLQQISKQTAGGNNLVIAYDASQSNQGVSWPLKWYLRDYPNANPFVQLTNDLTADPVIIVDQSNFQAIQPVVADQYYQFDYIRMVWPNQDYFALTWPRFWNAIANPKMRAAIFQIWLNRDYSLYAQATGQETFSPATWEPSGRMELFVRKDIAAQVWQYGVGQTVPTQADPYKQGIVVLNADTVFGSQGQGDGQMDDPHGLALAPDGSIFVADTNNNRIEHFAADGTLIKTWGSFADSSVKPIPLGKFNQPWGIALSPDGEWVYVADTWNHRIQKFTADGTPIATWGHDLFGQTEDPFGLWGPRGIAVNQLGNVFVADTGNKRIVVYDADGNFITQFGSEGMAPGQFDEPVGLAFDSQGNLYIADTWNQRVQVYAPNADGTSYSPLLQWDIAGWYGQSVENKPFLAVDNQDHIFITDPEMYRLLEFTTQGGFVRTWGDYGTDNATFGRAAAVAVDNQGHVWVSDSGNDRLMRFTLP